MSVEMDMRVCQWQARMARKLAEWADNPFFKQILMDRASELDERAAKYQMQELRSENAQGTSTRELANAAAAD